MTHNIGSPLLKGTTPESYNNYDYSNYFRFQNKRSLEEIDTLLAYQEKLRSQLEFGKPKRDSELSSQHLLQYLQSLHQQTVATTEQD
eukprot:403341824